MLLLGAAKSSGSQVAEMFRYTDLCQQACDLNEVVAVSGSPDPRDTLIYLYQAERRSCAHNPPLRATLRATLFPVRSAVLLAFEPASGSPLRVAQLTFLPAPCSSITQGPMTFTGSLTRQ